MAKRIMRPAILARQHRQTLVGLALVLVAVLVLVAMASYRAALTVSQREAEGRLTLQVNGLISGLEKYRLLTPLIARRPDILAVFSSNRDDEDSNAALEAMSRIGGMSGAAEIELTFLDGDRFSMLEGPLPAQSQQERAARLARQDIAQALQGRLGRGLLIEEPERHYLFSSVARIDGEAVGVVSVHVDLTLTEQNWALFAQPVAAVAGDHVVLSNRAHWHGALLSGMGAGQGAHAGGHAFLQQRLSQFGPILMDVVTGSDPGSVDGDYVAARYDDMLLGWTFYAMEPLRRAVFLAALAVVVAALVGLFLLGGLWVIFNRQFQQLVQRRKDMASALWLERAVRDRTRELRQTQEGLLHSAKLAAIGQMSAVISHEYNQPLAAIRSYADNAHLLFEKGRVEQGQDNLARIGRLVDRLANLSKNLKSFARRPGVDVRPVSAAAVVDEAVMLMQPRARKGGVRLDVVKKVPDFIVMAGHTRLEQVVINLLANALDALSEVENREQEPSIQVILTTDGADGIILVLDNGPGIARSLRSEIFEPFVTSKDRGSGLGLGLPIAFNLIKGFGGGLSLKEPDQPGWVTEFEVRLPLAELQTIDGQDLLS